MSRRRPQSRINQNKKFEADSALTLKALIVSRRHFGQAGKNFPAGHQMGISAVQNARCDKSWMQTSGRRSGVILPI